ncbi:MAG: NAD(P)-binding domain-containing protein [Anaeromyxobacter sp.]|nr:NAD(P)-binding domain-containing protein [Anaeromyxobacter sp.]MBL0274982.1 NAD(P)-binding domain-containing protein [Anaeromyxobacter sp.]
MDRGLIIVIGALSAAFVAGVYHLVRRALRDRRDSAALRLKIEKNQHIPKSLHPVVDTDVCIGSLSCLKACPEGDILGIVDHAARLVHADHCIGHGKCAAECPVGAIKLVFGTSERGVDLPEVDQYFESSRPGVHVVGELGGMGLIKNAITQGLQVAERLAEVVTGGGQVVVVGAGPAGLGTALGLKARGVAFRLLEQDTLGGSVAHYPRRKVAMTERVELPFIGKFGKKLISKEELLEGWAQVVAKADLRLEQGVKVGAIEGQDGRFQVHTSAGVVEAAKVVLAIGRRGTPRKLGAPGEDQEKVLYGLKDPDQFDGQRVLVVGGGDSALEAAIQLATESSAEVAISYRSPEFGRCREANRARLGQLVAAGKVKALMASTVTAIDPDEVRLDVGGHAVHLPNDFVIVNVGGELPTEFLQQAGVTMRRFHGEALGSPKAGQGAQRRRHAGTADDLKLMRRLWILRGLYTVAGAALLAFLTWKGFDYYELSKVARLGHPRHLELKSAGPWGHGVGIVATAFMLSNFLYAVRKRGEPFMEWGDIRGWLDFHVFVGTMSPLVIAFHAAFQANNVLATATTVALGVVMATGIIGRYIFGLVPAQGGRAEAFEDLTANFERLRAFAAPGLAHVGPGAAAILDRATAPVQAGSMLTLFLRFPFETAALRLRLRWLRRRFPDPETYLDLKRALVKLMRLRWQLRFYGSLKALLRGWRVFHATMAIFLVLSLSAHIAVSLYLGYGLK